MKIKVGDKTLTISKWKGRNKKEFVKAIRGGEVNERSIMDILVYSCIEEDTILSLDEFRYVLSKIREYSLGDDITIEFYCEKCGELFTKEFKISEIVKYTYKKLNEIKVDDIHIKFGPIRNKEAYLSKISEDPDYDIFFNIESINGNNAFTLGGLIDMFDDMNIDTLTEIMKMWEESRFKIDDIKEVSCSSCNHTVKYKFDEIPGFFPESWFE